MATFEATIRIYWHLLGNSQRLVVKVSQEGNVSRGVVKEQFQIGVLAESHSVIGNLDDWTEFHWKIEIVLVDAVGVIFKSCHSQLQDVSEPDHVPLSWHNRILLPDNWYPERHLAPQAAFNTLSHPASRLSGCFTKYPFSGGSNFSHRIISHLLLSTARNPDLHLHASRPVINCPLLMWLMSGQGLQRFHVDQ